MSDTHEVGTYTARENRVGRGDLDTSLLRPVLSLQTIYFHESDHEQAIRLGKDLYQLLTRPLSDPLGYGANIPVQVGVSAERVDLEAADIVVLIPVLGKTAFNMNQAATIKLIQEWHERLGPGHVLPIPTSPNWRSAESEFPGKTLLTELYSATDPRRKTLDEIMIAVARLLDSEPEAVQLFVSHAKADVEATDSAAKKIHDYVVTEGTGSAFFDANDLRPGESLGEQLDTAVFRGVIIAVRGDVYSSRVWCQRELLQAKRNGVPTLIVEVLSQGEQRSSPYSGNSPCLVWEANPAPIVSRAIVEWLRAAYFRREAPRIIKATDLPNDVIIATRPPELLDLAQGPLGSEYAQLVLHPDPELSIFERQVLRAARPRLQLVTPATAFRRLLTRDDRKAKVSSPLEGMQVAMSLSDTPDADGPDGYTSDHVIDATVFIARTLISAGAAIAYGGSFRISGFTPLLAELIQSHNQTASKSAQSLHSYLAALIRPEDAPDNLPLMIHHLVQSEDVANDAIMPGPPEIDRHPAALYFSDMRRVMALHTQARVILGGKAAPRIEEQDEGYRGRYPGVVEEAWRTLEAKQPLYIIGGFGGAAALVADLCEKKPTPPQLQDKTWEGHAFFTKNTESIESDPFREKLGLPQRMEDLVLAIRDYVEPLLESDDASLGWNGLTINENEVLFRSRDPITVASLVSKGLLCVAREKCASHLMIELVNDSVTAASELDVIAIATLEEVPLGGAGAILDQAAGGRASLARAGGTSLVSMQESTVDAQWLLMVSLGKLDDASPVEDRVKQAALETAEQANRLGFERLGVVTFGGSMLSDTEATALAMLKGFGNLPSSATVTWFESSAERFQQLKDFLKTQPGVKLTTRRAVVPIAPRVTEKEPLILQVRLEGSELAATALLPSGSAVASIRRVTVSQEMLTKLSEGSGHKKRGTPNLATLRDRGAELAQALLGEDAAVILARSRDSKFVVVHDVPASKLPFEMLATLNPEIRPALESGIIRRLAVAGVPVKSQFAQPTKKGKLNVLLIVNPTEDLPGTVAESKAVIAILDQQKERVKLTVLSGKEATKAAVIEALGAHDVLHYCGHGFFNGPGADESGLFLAGREPLTATDLSSISSLPRMAFVNACEAGRVRGQVETDAAAFAELFLRSGVEAYLGTYWEVQDSAAASFATDVYVQLAIGETLEAAVLTARKGLFDRGEPDWANYILFGGGNFRLVVG